MLFWALLSPKLLHCLPRHGRRLHGAPGPDPPCRGQPPPPPRRLLPAAALVPPPRLLHRRIRGPSRLYSTPNGVWLHARMRAGRWHRRVPMRGSRGASSPLAPSADPGAQPPLLHARRRVAPRKDEGGETTPTRGSRRASSLSAPPADLGARRLLLHARRKDEGREMAPARGSRTATPVESFFLAATVAPCCAFFDPGCLFACGWVLLGLALLPPADLPSVLARLAASCSCSLFFRYAVAGLGLK